ncbi:hypothetical protein PV735_05430 [Streptomyces turgidiscabies]|uniref:Uncharacterized protein n=1 Tax=Streptomyces turgidiscabies (strain Car8) TaxID=698760 RepID=L7EZ42_STRT8|nr:hypothetical protein [Streptomyces turgidiscabies]ELP64144.1 hypothetical protein STRTUCAR8_05562 [Streptomyces turgidiscabies Car8]MDX3492131.1 hypothetical protein [Streptomyces turgidiscabies]
MTGRPILVVLAADQPRFNAWCYNSGLSPTDPDVQYADIPEHLRGLGPDVKVIRCPGWELHRHAQRLDQTAQIIEHRRRQTS